MAKMAILISPLKANLVGFDKSGGNPNSKMGNGEQSAGVPLLILTNFKEIQTMCIVMNSIVYQRLAPAKDYALPAAWMCQNFKQVAEKWSRYMPSGPRKTVV